MQYVVEKPPREFFKPASYQNGSQRSDYRGSPDSKFFNVLKNGITNGQNNLFTNDNVQKIAYVNNLRRHSSQGYESNSNKSETNDTLNNTWESVDQPPNYRLTKDQLHSAYDQPQDIQLAAERYAAYGARPMMSPQTLEDKKISFNKNDVAMKERKMSGRKRGYRDSRKLFNFLWVLIFLLIALGGVSLGLGLYYGLCKLADSTMDQNSRVFVVNFTIINATFNGTLSNRSSEGYTTWAEKVCTACSTALTTNEKGGSGGSLVQNCSEISFRSGSIKVSIVIQLTSSSPTSEINQRFQDKFPFSFLSNFECRLDSLLPLATTGSSPPTSNAPPATTKDFSTHRPPHESSKPTIEDGTSPTTSKASISNATKTATVIISTTTATKSSTTPSSTTKTIATTTPIVTSSSKSASTTNNHSTETASKQVTESHS